MCVYVCAHVRAGLSVFLHAHVCVHMCHSHRHDDEGMSRGQHHNIFHLPVSLWLPSINPKQKTTTGSTGKAIKHGVKYGFQKICRIFYRVT